MIDLHLHLLHATDDGALDLAQAVAMAGIAAADGCEALIATPHQRRDEWETSDPRRLEERLAEIREAAAGGAPALHLGAEVRVDSDLPRDLARRDKSGVLPLAGSQYILLEFDPMGVGPEPGELLREVVALGFRPIVAHPEMTPFFWDEEIDWFPRLVEAGAALQVTAMSVTGEFGRGARERAWRLLEDGLVSFVASDAHRSDWRPPGLSRARDVLAQAMGESVARALTADNARAILENRPLAMPAARTGPAANLEKPGVAG